MWLLSSVFAKTTLYADRIERTSWFSKKEVMLRKNIGRIRYDNYSRMGYGALNILFYSGVVLEDKRSHDPRNVGTFYPTLPLGYTRKDAAWEQWMASLPGYDALGAQSRQPLGFPINDPPMSAEAKQKWAKTENFFKWMTIAFVVVFIIALIYFKRG